MMNRQVPESRSHTDPEGRYVMALAALFAALLLMSAGCTGHDTLVGVTLAPVHTATPESPPTPSQAQAAHPTAMSLTGTLVYVRGGTLAKRDMESGETVDLDDGPIFGPLAWSPDGHTVVFSTGGDIRAADLDAETSWLVESSSLGGYMFRFSPDGKWVTYMSGERGRRIHLALVSGGDARQVAVFSHADVTAGWTPEGLLVYQESGQETTPAVCHVYDPESGSDSEADCTELQVVTTFQDSAAFDGERYLLTTVIRTHRTADGRECGDTAIAVSGPGNPSAPDVIFDVQGGHLYAPKWLPDGRVTFVLGGYGECGVEDEVWDIMIGLPGEEPERLAGPIGNADDRRQWYYGPDVRLRISYTVSPEGTHVAWIAGGYAARVSQIMVTDVATHTTQTLLETRADEAESRVDYLEHLMFRQVYWLP